MTLRTHLAGQALAGLCANEAFLLEGFESAKRDRNEFTSGVALSAVRFADALLAELAKEKAT